MRASLENALASGEHALTGPVARGDTGTIEAHGRALERDAAPDLAEAYRALSAATARRAVARGLLTPAQGERIMEVLNSEPEGPR